MLQGPQDFESRARRASTLTRGPPAGGLASCCDGTPPHPPPLHTHIYWGGHLARDGGPAGTRIWHLGEGSQPQSSPQVTQPHQADILK